MFYTQVFRNDGDVPLKNGDSYIPGEVLLVMLYGPKDNGLQYVLEVNNAKFASGGCDGRRIANVKLGKLNVPADATDDITIVSGWALGYDNVKLTPTFRLIPSKQVVQNDPTSTVPIADSEAKTITIPTIPAVEAAIKVSVQDSKNNPFPPTTIQKESSIKPNLRTGNAVKSIIQDSTTTTTTTTTTESQQQEVEKSSKLAAAVTATTTDNSHNQDKTTTATAISKEKPIVLTIPTDRTTTTGTTTITTSPEKLIAVSIPLEKTTTATTNTASTERAVPDPVQSGSVPDTAEKLPSLTQSTDTTTTTTTDTTDNNNNKETLKALDLTEIEDIDQEENLDMAIEKMQKTLNKMKKKQLLKKTKTTVTELAHNTHDKHTLDADKSDTKPIKLKLNPKTHNTHSSGSDTTITTSIKKSNKDNQEDLGLNTEEMGEIDGDSTEEEGEIEEGSIEEEGDNEIETASQVRLRHNTQKKRKYII